EVSTTAKVSTTEVSTATRIPTAASPAATGVSAAKAVSKIGRGIGSVTGIRVIGCGPASAGVVAAAQINARMVRVRGAIRNGVGSRVMRCGPELASIVDSGRASAAPSSESPLRGLPEENVERQDDEDDEQEDEKVHVSITPFAFVLRRSP